MSQLDLSDALPRSPACDTSDSEREEHGGDDSDAEGSFSSPLCPQGDTLLHLAEGMDLIVSPSPSPSLRTVANLVLAVNKMSKSLSGCGRGLGHQQLCSAIMENVMECVTVQTQGTESESAGGQCIFQRCDSVQEHTLCDKYKKDLIHTTGELKLQAVTLQGGNCQRKVSFKFSRYVCPVVSSGEAQIVNLSLGGSLHLSCCMVGDSPELMLEECGEEDLSDIGADRDTARFLFYKRAHGKTWITFESVKHRGWYISTSEEEDDQQVEMCRVDATSRLTNFQMQPV